MKGVVDDDLRALIEVFVGGDPEGDRTSVIAWVDTAFNGGLVLPRHEIARLGLKEYSSVPAILSAVAVDCQSRSFLPESTLQLAATCDLIRISQTATRRR